MTPIPLRTSFGATSTAAQVMAGLDLTGRRAIVTGATAGLGRETTRALAAAGAEVTIASRDVAVGQQVADELRPDVVGNLVVRALDLADRRSIAAFIDGWHGPLDILVDNAGVMATPELRTREGWELQLAVNHLGHAALTVGLHAALGAAGDARVVVVSSVGHLNGDFDFDDPQFRRRPYDRWAAYSQSKTANILFSVGAAARWAPDGISVNALTPGRIRTGLMRHIGDETNAAVPARFDATSVEIGWKTVEQGAATSVLLAASPLVDGVSGRYFEDVNEAERAVPGVRRGVAAYAVDPDRADLLWQFTADTFAGRLA